MKIPKSLLALVLVPTLFAAQLTGLAGSTPSAQAALTFSVVATASVAPGGTLTVNAAGLSTNTAVTVAVNAPNPSNASSHYTTISTTANGDTTENPPYVPIATYANVLAQTVTSSGSGALTASFTIPSSAAPGVYKVTVADTNSAGDLGSTTFVVTGANALLVNGSSGTNSIPLGGQFSVYNNGFTAGSTVSFALENFAQSSTVTGIPTASAASGLGTTASLAAIPLKVVACSSGATLSGNSCVLSTGITALNATLQLSSTDAANHLLSSSFYDQIYTVVATGTGGGSTAGGTVTVNAPTGTSSTSYPLTIVATSGSFDVTITNSSGTAITSGAIAYTPGLTPASLMGTLQALAGVGKAVVTGTDITVSGVNGGPFLVTFSGATTASDATAAITAVTDLATPLVIPAGTITPTTPTGTPATVTLTGASGTFNLTVTNGSGTPIVVTGLPVTSTGAAVQAALRALAGSGMAIGTGTDVTVTGSAGGPYTVTFINTGTTGDVNALIAGTTSAGAPTVTVGTATVTTGTGSGTLTFTNPTAGGTFTLSVTNPAVGAGSESTGAITYPASATTANVASAITTALNAPGMAFVTTGTGAATTSCSSVTLCTVTFTGAALSAALVGGTSTLSLSSTAGIVTEAAGIKLDHSLSVLNAGSTFVAPGSTVSVSGYNWAAGSTVYFFFGDQIGGSPLCTFSSTGTVGSETPAYTSVASATGATCGQITSTTVGANGTFSGVSVQLPATSANGSYSGGKILAEDIAPGTSLETGHRLNESAYVSFLVSSTAITTGGLQLSTTTPAIGQTVTFTATGFLASTSTAPQNATLTLSGGTTCSSYPFPSMPIDTTGTVHGAFTVPSSCGLTSASSSTVSLTGPTASGGSQTVSATITIPTTTLTASTNGTTITYSGTGFWSGESVAVQLFSTVSVGTAGTALGIITAGADGTISGSAPNPVGLATGFYFIEASGISSGLTATANVGYSVGGILNCPTFVIPGQIVTLTGTQFTAPAVGATGVNTLGLDLNPTAITAVPLNVDATGNMTATFTVPTTTISGTYHLTANTYVPGTSMQQQRFCTINVVTGKVASITANPTSSAVGGTTAITATGFLPNELVTVALQYTSASGLAGTTVPGTAQTFTADATGAISGTFTVKSTVGALVPGAYNLVALGQSSGLIATLPFTVTGGALAIGAATSNIYFAEGFTGTTAGGSNANFNESISILNANNFTTTYTVTYFLENKGAASTTKVVSGTIGMDSVVERAVNTDAGANLAVAAQVSSPAPLAATRVIARTSAAGATLDSSSSLGQQLDLTASGPFSYYLASGEIMPTNEQYLTILNPNSTAAAVTVTVLPQSAISSTSVAAVAPITISVPANSRLTEPIRKDLRGKGFVKFGVSISSSLPVASERVEYYGDGMGSGKYGASVKPAASSAFRQYIFASDTGTFPSTGGNTAVGTGKDSSEIDVVNPALSTDTSGSATVTVSFFDKNGKAINSQQVQVDPGTRDTVGVNDVVGTQGDVFSTVVTSDKNVFVERPTFYGGDPTLGGMFAVATPSGSPAGLTSVAFPYLDLASASGAAISQTVYLYNPGATAITVRGIFAGTSATVVKTYTVVAGGITAVSVNSDASTLPKGALGGLFQVVASGTGSSDAFVALTVSNSPDYKVVLGNQGTYPIAAVTGF